MFQNNVGYHMQGWNIHEYQTFWFLKKRSLYYLEF